MSLITALQTLEASLSAISGLPDCQFVIPDQAMQGPFPGFYYEPADTSFEYGGLQYVYSTSEKTFVSVLIVIHKNSVTPGSTLLEELLGKEKLVKTKLESDTAAYVFAEDGGVGFAVRLVSSRRSFSSNQDVAAALLTLSLEAYEQ